MSAAQLGLFAPAAPTIEGIDAPAVFASSSADIIALQSKVRRPVSCGGDLWVNTGSGRGAGVGKRSAELYRLAPISEFDGEPTTYNEKLSIVREGDAYAGDYARNDPNGFYHGMTVKWGGQAYALCGPPQLLTVDAGAEPDLFSSADHDDDDADEDDEDDDAEQQLACSDCGVDLRQADSYHDTPCGLFCEGCTEVHTRDCVECAAELAAEREMVHAAAQSMVLAPPEPAPIVAPTVKRDDARRLPYTGPFPRKRHYHRCPKCVESGSNGTACYMKKCTRAVLMDTPCGFCGGVPRR